MWQILHATCHQRNASYSSYGPLLHSYQNGWHAVGIQTGRNVTHCWHKPMAPWKALVVSYETKATLPPDPVEPRRHGDAKACTQVWTETTCFYPNCSSVDERAAQNSGVSNQCIQARSDTQHGKKRATGPSRHSRLRVSDAEITQSRKMCISKTRVMCCICNVMF